MLSGRPTQSTPHLDQLPTGRLPSCVGNYLSVQGYQTPMSAESITVLFVDDDEQWAQYMISELEAEDPDLSVSVAGNVNEAILALGESHRIDCVVTDFRMPEVDGIQLLEHVQQSHPHLPFILVTGDGSEDVAARAI